MLTTIGPRPTRRTRSKHGGKKPTIEERLLAAMERMLEQGQRFVTLSVEELAVEAGMSRGTFYSHFRDKNELIARLMSLITDEIVDSAGSWLGTGPGGERPLRQDMEATMIGVSKTFRKHHAILSAFNDSARNDEALGIQHLKMMDTICGRCRAAIAAVNRSGACRPETGDDVADALSWFVVTYLGRFSAIRHGEDLDRLIKAVAHVSACSIFADEKS